MSGNVWEWCNDRYDSNDRSRSSVTDPIGPRSGVNRVRRGGSWHNSAYDSRVAECGYSYPVKRFNGYGFRVALSEFPPDESE